MSIKIKGIDLISQEREEQLTKHGITVESDVENNNEYQLVDAASALVSPHEESFEEMYVQTQSDYPPVGWDKEPLLALLSDKEIRKPYKDRLVIAGALIAAEIDRINAVVTQSAKEILQENLK